MADVEHPGIRCTAEGSLTAALASDAVLDAAFGWLCKRRRAWPADADLWSFRHDWPDEKAAHQRGAARRPVPLPTTAARDQGADGSEADLCSARDALVLKGLALVLARV